MADRLGKEPVIVFLDSATLSAPIMRPGWGHAWQDYATTHDGDVAHRIANADVVIVNKVRLTSEAIEAAENLSMVLVAATGIDNLDTVALEERRIAWHNVVGYGSTSVAEHVMAMILALRRNLVAYRQAVLQGRWEESGQFCFHDYPITELKGATLAILGGGAIGQRVAELARVFGVNVIFAERKGHAVRPGRVAFEEALASADVISLHCPLTEHTHHLLDEDAFAAIQRRPLIINTARGGLIKACALISALREGKISGAALDVLENEPLAKSDPIQSMMQQPNVIVTPHVAWAGQRAQQVVAQTLHDKLNEWHKSRPQP